MKNKRILFQKCILPFILLILCMHGFAQQKGKLSGTVFSEIDGEPLIGATVYAKDVNRGTITDLNGNFSFPNGTKIKTLRISSIGYVTQNIQVKPGKPIVIRLKEDIALIDEVVVIGYGTQKKKEVTGAVGSVGADELSKTASADLGTALQGLVSGVNVQASSGEPGSMANVQIRGIGSVSGSNEPLYVVDGIPYDGVPYLNSNEVERMDILKDAASASIYGTRASNGVVLITTKQGKSGKMRINVNAYYGLQNLQHTDIPVCNVAENTYVTYLRNSHRDGNIGFLPLYYNPFGAKYDINWLEHLIVNNAPIQEYSLGLSGGSPDFVYNLTATYFGQDGTMVNSDYKQGSVRLNTTFTRDKFKVISSVSGNVRNRTKFPGAVIQYALSLKPYDYVPMDGSTEILVTDDDPTTSSASQAANRMANLCQRFVQKNLDESSSVNANVQIQYRPTKSLTAAAKVAYMMGNTYYSEYMPQLTIRMSDGSLSNQTDKYRSYIFNRHNKSVKYSMEYSLSYIKSFQKKHNINALVNVSYEESENKMFSAKNYDLLTNEIQVLDAATGNAVAAGNRNKETLIGALGRFQYNYHSKYMVSLSARLDGTSRFNSSNRWGLFPSVMLGWNVSDEKFWQPVKKVISTFRLRASRGMTGNNRFSNIYIAQTVLDERYDYVFGEEVKQAKGMIQKALANGDIKWETSISNNIGLDMAFLNNRITLGVDAYIANKKDMLFDVSVPPSVSGVTNQKVVMNVGDMRNKGIEIDLKYKWTKKKHNLTVGVNWSTNSNKVTKISDNTDVMYIGPEVNGIKMLAIKKGYQAGAFFLIPTDGTIKNDKELKEYQNATGDMNAHVGSLRYVDTDGVRGINDADRVYYGGGAPKWEAGLNINYSYKNWDVSAQLYASIGGKVMNVTKQIAYEQGSHKDLLHSWATNNPTSNIPLVYSDKETSHRVYSDYFLEDGDFLRLRNVTVGYTLSKKWCAKIGLSNCRFYVAAQNMLTLSKYTGFDPEVGGDGLATKGIDNGNYPVCGQIRLGTQITF